MRLNFFVFEKHEFEVRLRFWKIEVEVSLNFILFWKKEVEVSLSFWGNEKEKNEVEVR